MVQCEDGDSIIMNNAKIKVLFFIDSFRIGGMHRQVLYLLRGLNRQEFEPIMCTSNSEGGLRKDYEATGCKLYSLNWTKRIDPPIIGRLIDVLKEVNPDIVFVCEAQNLVYYRIAKLFWRGKAAQIGSFRALTFWLGHDKLHLRKIDNFFSRWLFRSSRRIVTNSYGMKNHYDQVVPKDKKKQIEVIYNGSDFNFLVNRRKDEVRAEIKIKNSDILIIMVARLDPWKDFDTLLLAMGSILKDFPHAKLLLLGDGILRVAIEQKIKDLGLQSNVLLIGERKDVFNYLNASDISVLSTNGEGFSNAILESMAMGKPIIATAVGGNVEVIGQNNEFGTLVAPKSVDELVVALKSYLYSNDLRATVGEKAKNRIYELCSMQTYVKAYEKLFKESVDR